MTTWASEVLERSSPTLYRPDGYVAFDAIVNWSPRWVPGLTLRASVLNFTDARYFRSLNGATTYPIVPSTAVAIANPLELQTAPGRTFKVGATYHVLTRRPLCSSAMNRMHARIRFDAFSEPTIFRIRR